MALSSHKEQKNMDATSPSGFSAEDFEDRFSAMPSLVQPAYIDSRNPDAELELGVDAFQPDAFNEPYDKLIHQDFFNGASRR